jgi:hypothetical protein
LHELGRTGCGEVAHVVEVLGRSRHEGGFIHERNFRVPGNQSTHGLVVARHCRHYGLRFAPCLDGFSVPIVIETLLLEGL